MVLEDYFPAVLSRLVEQAATTTSQIPGVIKVIDEGHFVYTLTTKATVCVWMTASQALRADHQKMRFTTAAITELIQNIEKLEDVVDIIGWVILLQNGTLMRLCGNGVIPLKSFKNVVCIDKSESHSQATRSRCTGYITITELAGEISIIINDHEKT